MTISPLEIGVALTALALLAGYAASMPKPKRVPVRIRADRRR
jgi:hypothetical protein